MLSFAEGFDIVLNPSIDSLFLTLEPFLDGASLLFRFLLERLPAATFFVLPLTLVLEGTWFNLNIPEALDTLPAVLRLSRLGDLGWNVSRI